MRNSRTFLLALSIFGAAQAATITPVSYAYTGGTAGGEAGYTDPSNSKLTDGIFGTTNFTDGTWVLWQSDGAPQITFTFAASVHIDNIALDMEIARDANTTLPESVTVNGGAVSTGDTLSGDPVKGILNYAGSWTGSTLVLTLGHTTNHWIGVNEVTFSGNSAATEAPEPAPFALIGGTLLAVAWKLRR